MAKSKTSKKTTSRASKIKGVSTRKRATSAAKNEKLSALDAAAKVLADSEEPMNCKELVETLAARKLWTSPGGKTPHATLYSAILREINNKGKDARFKKSERGKFVVNA